MTEATKVTLSKKAPWATAAECAANHLLRNTYRERFAYVEGRRFRVSADSMDAMWWVEEVEADGNPSFGKDHRVTSFGEWVFNLASARRLIAGVVEGDYDGRR